MELVPAPRSSKPDSTWVYQLIAGDIIVSGLNSSDINSLKEPESYNTELLPEIFTFREILWQPNVYPKPQLCTPQLNILKVFCEEYVESGKKNGTRIHRLYFELLSGLATYCSDSIRKITSSEETKEIQTSSILGELRKKAFPIIKFFIFHPMNRLDYQTDALNRLNYCVKIMLTQYHNKYYDLKDPYWNITLGKSISLNTQKTSVLEKQAKEELPEKASKTKESN